MAYIVQVAENEKAPTSKAYADKICDKITSTMPGVYITRVEAVQDNKFLHAAFQLRRAQHIMRHGSCPVEMLFHATASGNVKSILKENLDWRKVTRSRFGLGVSFSHSPQYANRFCNQQNGAERAFVVCHVLTANEMKVGCSYSSYPQRNIDTHRSHSNMVVVKFEDDTFYPTYVVYYRTCLIRPSRSIPTYVGFDADSDSNLDDFFAQMAKLRASLLRLTLK